jgi:hypothetical protein
MAASIEELVYETADKALTRQEDSVVQLRARTGMLLAAASLVASFFGVAALSQEGVKPWPALAIGAFTVCLGCSIYLLAPKTNLTFSIQARGLHNRVQRRTIAFAHLQMAAWLEQLRHNNRSELKRLDRVFVAACVALVAEVVFWTAALRGTL